MSGRGMKKWNAYKTLQEQFEDLDRLYEENTYVSRPILTDDEIQDINYILSTYNGGVLLIKYYRDGKINEVKSQISFIDAYRKVLKLPDDTIIRFSELIHLESSEFYFD